MSIRYRQDNNLPYFFAYFQLPYKFTKIILHKAGRTRRGKELKSDGKTDRNKSEKRRQIRHGLATG
jgi:hypothetical protein